jgi:hypothetical protein
MKTGLGAAYSERAKAPMVAAAPGKSSSLWIAAAVALVLVAVGLLAGSHVASIGSLHEKNYNEGWNIYNTARLIAGETIYDANYWRVNNYPIVSFVVVAGVNGVVHDLLLSGRIVALVAFFAIGILTAVITWRLGGDRLGSAFAGATALGFYYLMAPDWIAVDDPQSLAEALMLAGLAVYLGRTPTTGSLALAAMLIVLGGFTKHNLVAIPFAVSFDLAIRMPRRLPLWLAAAAASAMLLYLATELVAGGNFLEHLLSPRVFSWYHVHYHLMKFARLFKAPLLLVLLFSWRIFRGERLALAWYGVLSISAGALISGFEGTSYNMMQDAAVFLAVSLGLLLQEWRTWLSQRRIDATLNGIAASVAVLVLAAPIVSNVGKAVAAFHRGEGLLDADRAAEQSFAEDLAYLAARPGERICESLLLCYESGAPFALDPFNSRQYILAGKLDQGELAKRVVERDFSVIQLRADICDDPASATCHILHYPRKFNRFTDDVLYAVDRYYRIDRRSPLGVFYVPR